MYDDKDGARREEIASMSGVNVFRSFYDQLGSIREYHRKFPSVPSIKNYESELLTEVLESAPDEGFTGEEAEGKYVDMHVLHEAYLNLKGIERVDYQRYLKKATDLQAIPKTAAVAAAYSRYATELKEYLIGFIKRTQPLMPLQELLATAEDEFSKKWAEGTVARWQSAKSQKDGECVACDLSAYESAKALEALGLESLKAQLTLKGLKCGGTLAQRAERLFLAKATPLDQMPKKELAAKGGEGKASAGAAASAPRAVALVEEQVSRLGELLADVIEDTEEMVEKKQSRSYDEIARDLAAAEEADAIANADDEEEEEEKPIYNPLNLPLGWDGKPIPYWLYKLHGLNLEFKCEICGNYSYWGPRAYERHFQEWRHTYGMKCLGIPNSKHFLGITLIEDAYTLWAKLKAEQGGSSWNPELDEEFEDKTGNVMNRKTYTDLARQGLLD